MNLNIEGTKHEKAVLVILSYVLGFTAGFLVFGLYSTPPLQSSATTIETPVPIESVAEVTEIPEDEMVMEEAELEMSQQVMYKDGRLMANNNGASVLLSAQIQTVDPETAKAFAMQGVHEAIPQYLASAAGNFIYYCEQHSTEDLCSNFIYDVSNQVIQYVTVDGVKLVSTGDEAKNAQWTDDILTIGTATSVDAATPWKLTSAQ